ncbi:MAG: hypothetical protein M3R35_07430, partial [Candidatus Eremiobacteraeota bacterium]|nr:hypothetical protein [Candidatus Eremiobacteraeota bacterium]
SDAGVTPRAYVLGGNANTLAFVNSLLPERNLITARLAPVAMTPMGTAIGDTWQNVQIAAGGLLEWVDQTFPSDDERAFVAPMRDTDLLARTQWHAEPPDALTDSIVLNIEECPGDIAEALAQPAEAIVQCGACRRLCVRDHFVWKDRQLCAWDYHKTVFGKRGPWHNGTYEARHFETIPALAYIAPEPLDEIGVDVAAIIYGTDDETAQAAISLIMEREPERAHMAIRSSAGYALLRERAPVTHPS